MEVGRRSGFEAGLSRDVRRRRRERCLRGGPDGRQCYRDRRRTSRCPSNSRARGACGRCRPCPRPRNPGNSRRRGWPRRSSCRGCLRSRSSDSAVEAEVLQLARADRIGRWRTCGRAFGGRVGRRRRFLREHRRRHRAERQRGGQCHNAKAQACPHLVPFIAVSRTALWRARRLMARKPPRFKHSVD